VGDSTRIARPGGEDICGVVSVGVAAATTVQAWVSVSTDFPSTLYVVKPRQQQLVRASTTLNYYAPGAGLERRNGAHSKLGIYEGVGGKGGWGILKTSLLTPSWRLRPARSAHTEHSSRPRARCRLPGCGDHQGACAGAAGVGKRCGIPGMGGSGFSLFCKGDDSGLWRRDRISGGCCSSGCTAEEELRVSWEGLFMGEFAFDNEPRLILCSQRPRTPSN
jgi:hypothetical protein